VAPLLPLEPKTLAPLRHERQQRLERVANGKAPEVVRSDTLTAVLRVAAGSPVMTTVWIGDRSRGFLQPTGSPGSERTPAWLANSARNSGGSAWVYGPRHRRSKRASWHLPFPVNHTPWVATVSFRQVSSSMDAVGEALGADAPPGIAGNQDRLVQRASGGAARLLVGEAGTAQPDIDRLLAQCPLLEVCDPRLIGAPSSH
jgi:hypothetical protein